MATDEDIKKALAILTNTYNLSDIERVALGAYHVTVDDMRNRLIETRFMFREALRDAPSGKIYGQGGVARCGRCATTATPYQLICEKCGGIL